MDRSASTRVVLFPNLKLTKKRRRVLIENPTIGTRLLAREKAVELLEFFRRPRTLAAEPRSGLKP